MENYLQFLPSDYERNTKKYCRCLREIGLGRFLRNQNGTKFDRLRILTLMAHDPVALVGTPEKKIFKI